MRGVVFQILTGCRFDKPRVNLHEDIQINSRPVVCNEQVQGEADHGDRFDLDVSGQHVCVDQVQDAGYSHQVLFL